MAKGTRTTILLAMGANLAIALAKLVGGLITGSAAMFAESAHSVADTTNQVFLLVSLQLATREPTETHPFGHGKERFFWALLAAVMIFVSGAVFSIFEGIHDLLGPGSEEKGGYLVAYVILAASFVAEGISFVRASQQTRDEAGGAGVSIREFLRHSKDPTVKTVLFEDSAALAGLMVAAAGLALHQVTGSPAWDASASVVIGALLAVVGFVLGRDSKELLVGEAASPRERETIARIIREQPGIDVVLDVMTMAIGPDELLVAAKVDLDGGLDSDEVERLSDRIEEELRQAVPAVRHVFLDATARRPRSDDRS
jgi:cation diffusion facilitator family transporter